MSKSLTEKWAGNFVFVAIHYFSNYILIIVLPFLAKKLGISTFGNLSFTLTLMNFFIVFIDYGFNITSIKNISLNWGNSFLTNKTVSNVYFIKIFLYIFCLTTAFVSIYFSAQLQKDTITIYSGLFYVMGILLFPTWFFQAIQKLQEVIFLNLLLKLLALISIYYIIDTSSESYWFFILIGGANMLTGIYSIYILQTKYNISFVVPKAREVKEILINDFPLLLSNILSIMLLSTNVTILKFTISEQELGLYSLSERILYALWQILSVFAVSIYPYICNFNKDTLIKLRKFLANIFFPFFGIVLIISLIVAFFSDKIVQFLFINSIAPDSLQISGQLLKFMMLTFILACTNIPAHQTLLAYGYKNICTKIFTIAVILNIFLGLIGSHLYGIIGITISFTIVILFLSIALNLTAFKKLNA